MLGHGALGQFALGDTEPIASTTEVSGEGYSLALVLNIHIFDDSPELVLPQVASASLLLDLRADNTGGVNNQPLDTFTDLSGSGNHFTQAGDASPTFLSSVGGYPAVVFDGLDTVEWMLGPSALDDLPSFAVFFVANYPAIHNDSMVLSKENNLANNSEAAWRVCIGSLFLQTDWNNWLYITNNAADPTLFHVYTCEVINRNTAHVYVDGSNTGESIDTGGTITTWGNSEPLRLGAIGTSVAEFNSLTSNFRGLLFYAPAPNEADRAAIEAWLAARYGITL